MYVFLFENGALVPASKHVKCDAPGQFKYRLRPLRPSVLGVVLEEEASSRWRNMKPTNDILFCSDMAQKPRRSPAVFSTSAGGVSSAPSSHGLSIPGAGPPDRSHAQRFQNMSSDMSSAPAWPVHPVGALAQQQSAPRARRSPAVLAAPQAAEGPHASPRTSAATASSPSRTAALPRLPAVSALQSRAAGRAAAASTAEASAAARGTVASQDRRSATHGTQADVQSASNELVAAASAALHRGDAAALACLSTRSYAGTVSQAASGVVGAQHLVGMQATMLCAAAGGDVASLIVVLRNAGSPVPPQGKLPSEGLLLSAQRHAAVLMRLMLHEHALRYGSAADQAVYRVEGAPLFPRSEPPPGPTPAPSLPGDGGHPPESPGAPAAVQHAAAPVQPVPAPARITVPGGSEADIAATPPPPPTSSSSAQGQPAAASATSIMPPPRRRNRSAESSTSSLVHPPSASPGTSASPLSDSSLASPAAASTKSKPVPKSKPKDTSTVGLSGQGGGNVRSVRRALPHLPFMQTPTSLLWPACLAAPHTSKLAVPVSLLQGLILHAGAMAGAHPVWPGCSAWQQALGRLLHLPAVSRRLLLCTASALVRVQMTQFSTGHRYTQAVRTGLQGWLPKLREALAVHQASQPSNAPQRNRGGAAVPSATSAPLAHSVDSVVASIKATAPWSIGTMLQARERELQHQRRCARVMAAAARAHSLLRAARVGGAGAEMASSAVSNAASGGAESQPDVQQLLCLDSDDGGRTDVYTPLHCTAEFAHGASSSTMQAVLGTLVSELEPSEELLGPCVANVALHALGPSTLVSPDAPVSAPAGILRGVPELPDTRGQHAGSLLPQCRGWQASDSLPAKPTDSTRAAGSSSACGHGGGDTLHVQPAVMTTSRTLPKFVQRDVSALLGGTDPSDLRSTDISYALYLAQCTLAHPAVDAMLRSAEDVARGLDVGHSEDAVLVRRLGKGHVVAQLAAIAVIESSLGARAAVEAVQRGVHPVIVCTTLPNGQSAGDDKKMRLRTDPLGVSWSHLQNRAHPDLLAALREEGGGAGTSQALPSDLHSTIPDTWHVTTAASVEEALAVVQVQNAQLLGMLRQHGNAAEGRQQDQPSKPRAAASVLQGTLGRVFGVADVLSEASSAAPALLEVLPLAAAARPLLQCPGSQPRTDEQGSSPPRLDVGNMDSLLAMPPASPRVAAAMSSPLSAGRSAQRLDGGATFRRTKKQAAALASLSRSAVTLPLDQRQPDTVGCLLLLQALRLCCPPAHWPPRLVTLWRRRSMWLATRCMTFLTKATQGKTPWGTQSVSFIATTLLRPVSVNHLKLLRPFRLPVVTPPPRRAAWVSLRRNFFQEDDTTLHYKPYFGDDDERELDLTGYSHSKVHTAITATQSDGSVLAADTVGSDFASSELQGSTLSGSPLADLPIVGAFGDDGTPVPSPVPDDGDDGPLSLAAIMNADSMAAPGVATQLAPGGASTLSQRLHRSGVMGSTSHRVMLLQLVDFLSEALGYTAPPPAPSHPMVSSKFQANQRATTRDGVTYSASDAEEEAGRAFKQVRHCLALLVHCAGDSVLRSMLFPGVAELEDTLRRKGTPSSLCVRLDAAATNNVYCSSDFAVLRSTLRRMRALAPHTGKRPGKRTGKAKARSGRRQPKRARGSDDSGSSLVSSPSALDDDAASVATSVSGSIQGAGEDDDTGTSLDSFSSTANLVWSSDVPLLLAALVERWREVHATAARFRLCGAYGLLPQGHPLRCLPLLPALRSDATAGTAALLAAIAGDCIDSAQRQWLPLLAMARATHSGQGSAWSADVGLGDMPPETEAALVPHLLEIKGVVSALSIPSAQPWSSLHELGAETLGVRANASMRADMQQALDLPGDATGTEAAGVNADADAGQAEGDGSHETLNVIFCPMTKVYDDRQHGVLHALPTPREGEEITRKRLMHGHYLRNSKLFLLALREAAAEQSLARGRSGQGKQRARAGSAESSSHKAARRDDLPEYVSEALAHLSGHRVAAAARFGEAASGLAARAAALASAARLPEPSAMGDHSDTILTAREAALVPRLYRIAGGDVDAVCAMLGYDAETMAVDANDPLAVLPRCKRNLRTDLLEKVGLQDSAYAQLRARVQRAAAVAPRGEPSHSSSGEASPAATPDDDADTVMSGGVGGTEEEEEQALAAGALPPAPAPSSGRGRPSKKDGGPPPEGGITQSMLTRDAARLVAGEHKRVLVARSDIHGWGAFMGSEGAAARELVYEYRGELISQNEADRRGNIYDRLNMSYLFELSDLSVLDAARKGSKIRFANHSSNPNCAARVMSVLGGQRRIAFFARRNIAPGDELTFNYQYETDHSSAVRDNAASSGSGRGRGRKRQRSNKQSSKTPLLATKGLSGAAPSGGRARRGGGGGGGRRRRRES